MNSKKISEAMSELDSKYVEEAIRYRKEAKRPGWAKWGVVAACFAVVAILGVSLLQSGIFGKQTEIVTLSNGDRMVFVKSHHAGDTQAVDIDATIKPLTEAEAAALFPGLSFTGDAIFPNSNADTEGPQEPIGFVGQVETVKVIISTPSVQLLDTRIDGTEETCEVSGTTVTAGYFITDPNSRGEQNAIYYATYEIGGRKIYLENAGPKADSETIKKQLAEVIQELIENKAIAY